MSSPLDDPQTYRQYDPAGMLACLRQMPEQCRRAWQLAMALELPPDYTEIDRVVILGMGGSAIGGELACGLVANECRWPVLTHRDYDLPALVDARTLVIASSYSGMTEETLAAFTRALATEAKKLAITTGGRLASLAGAAGVPVCRFDYPAQPRAALPYSLLPILGVLQKTGGISDKSADVADTVAVLRGLAARVDEGVPSARNPAKHLAGNLHGKLPLIYGAGLTAAVTRRWKTQLNENSKTWAGHEAFPELNHNAVAGYRFPAGLARQIYVVMLQTASLQPRLRRRYQVTRQLLEQAGVSHQTVAGEGDRPLSQMMSLVPLGDYVSCYLALLYRTDPTPVPAIDYLKEQMGKD
ncbi:MAG: bifunctional phosphoglucose/phosphomannose isomerase [Chloroflexota bacterium]